MRLVSSIKYLVLSSHKQKGFTLVELILYMGLLSIFLVVLTDIFVAIFDVKTESEATSAVEQDGKFILARLNYDISRADTVNIPLALGASANNLVLTIGGVTYTYSESGGNFTLNDGSNYNLNSSESRLPSLPLFRKVGNSAGKETIQVQFSIESVAQRSSGVETRTFETAVGRR